MKIRTDFVTNSSSSNFSVVITVKDTDGNVYCLSDDLQDDLCPDDGGHAYFIGGLTGKWNRDVTLPDVTDPKVIQLFKNGYEFVRLSVAQSTAKKLMHIGTRVNFEVKGKSCTLPVHVKVGEKEIGTINHPTLAELIRSKTFNVSGTVAMFSYERLRKGYATAVAIKYHLDELDEEQKLEKQKSDALIPYQKLRELCDYLTEGLTDDAYENAECDEDAVEEKKHMRRMNREKKEFTDNILDHVKDITRVHKVIVEREYRASGEFAELVPYNDWKLMEYAKAVVASEGEKQKEVMSEMLRYMHEPIEDRSQCSFGSGLPLSYDWNDNNDLVGLCKHLVSGKGMPFEYGYEYQEYDEQTKQLVRYAKFNLNDYDC